MIEFLKSKGLYSVRKFAASSGFKSTSYIRMVLDGKRNLSSVSAKQMAKGLRLLANESKFFEKLVSFAQSTEMSEKDQLYKELYNFRRFQERKSLVMDQYEYFSNWHFSALFVALATKWRNKSVKAMALALEIDEAQIHSGLKTLERLGLIEKREGAWISKDILLETASEMNSLIVRNFHRQMLEKAMTCLDKESVSNRAFGGLTMALSKSAYEDIKRKLTEFRQALSVAYADDKDPERVYQLSLGLFPLVSLGDGEVKK